jgi:hypothetical protein
LGSLRLYATVGFVAPLLVVLQLTILRSSGMDAQFSTPTVIVTVIAALLFALFCFSLDYLVRFRQITTPIFMAVYAVGMILFSLVSSAFGGIQIFGQGTSTDPLSVIPAIIIFFFTSAGLFAWLPAVPPHKLSLSDVRAQFGSVLRNVLVIGGIGVYAAFVILTAGFLGGAGMAQVLSGNVGLTGASAPVFSAWITSGNLSVRYPEAMHYLSLTNRQIDFNTFSSFNGGKDISLRAPIQMIVDQVSQEMGELFSPSFAGYALDGQGSGLTLIGGQFTPPAEADRPNYARQRLHDLIQGEGEGIVYEPEHIFGSEARPIPGALMELKRTDESGKPVLVTIAAIDTATAHHLVYLVSSDIPAMSALRDQFFALLQSSP